MTPTRTPFLSVSRGCLEGTWGVRTLMTRSEQPEHERAGVLCHDFQTFLLALVRVCSAEHMSSAERI